MVNLKLLNLVLAELLGRGFELVLVRAKSWNLLRMFLCTLSNLMLKQL